MNEISPFAILNHSSPISMPMKSFRKIGPKKKKKLKLEIENEALMDGYTDGHSKGSDGIK